MSTGRRKGERTPPKKKRSARPRKKLQKDHNSETAQTIIICESSAEEDNEDSNAVNSEPTKKQDSSEKLGSGKEVMEAVIFELPKEVTEVEVEVEVPKDVTEVEVELPKDATEVEVEVGEEVVEVDVEWKLKRDTNEEDDSVQTNSFRPASRNRKSKTPQRAPLF